MNTAQLKRCDEFAVSRMVGAIRRKVVSKTRVVYLGRVWYNNENGKVAGKMWALLTLYYDNDGKLMYLLRPDNRSPEMWFLLSPTVH